MSDGEQTLQTDHANLKFGLTASEIVWRERQKMLERHGYLLRPRFRPGWVPSYLKDLDNAVLYEDSIYNRLPKLIDAKRLSDGTQVILKEVGRNSVETSIGSYFSSGDHAKDPMNHCAPVLDVVRDDSLPTLEFIVMPLLRPFNKPPFFNLEEILDFMKQAFEGLAFMHKLGVAHRDCSDKNIMFDAAGMYPKGFHAGLWVADSTGRVAHPLRRSDVPSVKYYFTDFGMSTRFQDGEPRLVVGEEGLDQDVPELSLVDPYDPFAVDVFVLGNVFKRNFTQKYSNARFLVPLTECMTEEEPTNRPSSSEALKRFNEMISNVPGYTRRWRLKEVGKGKLESFFCDIDSARRECFYILKSFLKYPHRVT